MVSSSVRLCGDQGDKGSPSREGLAALALPVRVAVLLPQVPRLLVLVGYGGEEILSQEPVERGGGLSVWAGLL